MTDHLAIVITAWATVAAAAAAIVAVFISHRLGKSTLEETRRATDATVRQAKLATAYQLIKQLDDEWCSSTMRAKRQGIGHSLPTLQLRPQDDAIDDILDFFETVARCVQDEVIPLNLAWDFFSYWLIPYWFIATPRIDLRRTSDPTIWSNLAGLMPTLLNYHADIRHCSVAEITPTPEERRAFLAEETRS